MKKQIGTPEILKKSHAHKSKKDYSRKGKKMDIRLFSLEDVKNVNLVKSDPPWEKGEGTIADYVFILEDK
jgi:hypothetical protein